MLTSEDRDEIKRIVGEMITKSALPPSGEQSNSIVDVTARAVEVFGSSEKALRRLKNPVRSLGDQTPISLLNSPDGVAQVQDTLGRIEYGVL